MGQFGVFWVFGGFDGAEGSAVGMLWSGLAPQTSNHTGTESLKVFPKTKAGPRMVSSNRA